MAKDKTKKQRVGNESPITKDIEDLPKIYIKDMEWEGYVQGVPRAEIRNKADGVMRQVSGESPFELETEEDKKLAEKIAKRRNRPRDEIMREQLVGTPEEWAQKWELVQDGGEQEQE